MRKTAQWILDNRERDKDLEPFLRENAMRGTGWLGEQLHLKVGHVRKIMIRLGIPRRPKTGAPMERNPFWRGGRTVDKDGYVLVKAPDHPHRTRAGYVREHRLVMEKALGRYLDPKEVVHHKGYRGNNHISNLELYPCNGEHMALEWKGRKHSAATREKMCRAQLQRRMLERQRGPQPEDPEGTDNQSA